MKHEQYWAEVHEPESKAWEGKPHGWIQWKGTDVCIDLHCVCGAHGHIDADFLYHYECLGCGRKYALSGHVKLIELTPEQAKFVDDGGGCAFRSDPDTRDTDPTSEPRRYVFDRYIDGRLMAEGVVVHATNVNEAVEKAHAARKAGEELRLRPFQSQPRAVPG